jgi:DNA-binding MarR family transcriptional regulator
LSRDWRFAKVRTQIALYWGNLLTVPPFAFLTNHGLALISIAQDPDARMRDIAGDVDITERAAQRIVADLIEAGYLDRERVGRRNRYTIRTGLAVALPASRDVDLSALLEVLLPDGSSRGRRRAMRSEPVPEDGRTVAGRASQRRKLRPVAH